MRRLIIAIFITISAGSGSCYADGLDSLIEVGKAQAEIQKAYKSETETYKSVQRAVDSGSIKKWQPKAEISKLYGEPVIVVDDQRTGRQKWVYKPAESDFMKGGPKVNLYFDAQGLLDEIEIEK